MLSTAALILLHPQLHAASLRHLDYRGGGQSFKKEVRAIEKIHLGPRLQSLRVHLGRRTDEDVPGCAQVLLHHNEHPRDQAHTYRTSAEAWVSSSSTEDFPSTNRTLFQIFEQFVTTGRGRSCKPLCGFQIHHTIRIQFSSVRFVATLPTSTLSGLKKFGFNRPRSIFSMSRSMSTISLLLHSHYDSALSSNGLQCC